MPKRKSKDSDYDHLMRKVRKLERKLRDQEREHDSRSRSRVSHSYTPPPPSPPRSLPPASPPPMAAPPAPVIQSVENLPRELQPSQLQPLPMPVPTTTIPLPEPTTTVPMPTTENVEEPQLSEEILLALGNEGEEKVETGEAINNELTMRWTKIMTEGLTKEQKEVLLEKYKTPQNFTIAVAPMLNKEIAATLSEISINRDKRIIARQNMTGKLMSCLGKSLTNILKGNINSKKLIEEINDAAKIASEIYFNDMKSRKFFALSSAAKAVQETCKDTKPGKYLFGDGLAEQLKSIQAVKRTATQIKASENKTHTTTTTKPPVNWRGPLQPTNQRGRGGQRPVRHIPVNQPPRRPALARGAPKHTPRRTNQRRY